MIFLNSQRALLIEGEIWVVCCEYFGDYWPHCIFGPGSCTSSRPSRTDAAWTTSWRTGPPSRTRRKRTLNTRTMKLRAWPGPPWGHRPTRKPSCGNLCKHCTPRLFHGLWRDLTVTYKFMCEAPLALKQTTTHWAQHRLFFNPSLSPIHRTGPAWSMDQIPIFFTCGRGKSSGMTWNFITNGAGLTQIEQDFQLTLDPSIKLTWVDKRDPDRCIIAVEPKGVQVVAVEQCEGSQEKLLSVWLDFKWHRLD